MVMKSKLQLEGIQLIICICPSSYTISSLSKWNCALKMARGVGKADNYISATIVLCVAISMNEPFRGSGHGNSTEH